jgi:CDP-diacylglycerol--serine O-phosphatidyltransferase
MNQSLPSHELFRVFLLSLPLVIGGILHMIAVKVDILSYLKKPIHQRWFGLNKTWRGFILMPLVTLPGVLLAQKLEALSDIITPLLNTEVAWKLALALGLGYCLAELPNSFIKRRLGVKEGQTSDRFKWPFVLLDQGDSAIGCVLAYKLLIPISIATMVNVIVFGTVLHLIINVSLYKAGIRKNPF